MPAVAACSRLYRKIGRVSAAEAPHFNSNSQCNRGRGVACPVEPSRVRRHARHERDWRAAPPRDRIRRRGFLHRPGDTCRAGARRKSAASRVDRAGRIRVNSRCNLALSSPAASRVSRIAIQHGDRDFLMVDKAHGKLFFFAGGRMAGLMVATL